MSELFRRLRCPATLLALYGTLHQLRRMAIYDEFCQSKQAVLFATDIAARGLGKKLQTPKSDIKSIIQHSKLF